MLCRRSQVCLSHLNLNKFTLHYGRCFMVKRNGNFRNYDSLISDSDLSLTWPTWQAMFLLWLPYSFINCERIRSHLIKNRAFLKWVAQNFPTYTPSQILSESFLWVLVTNLPISTFKSSSRRKKRQSYFLHFAFWKTMSELL